MSLIRAAGSVMVCSVSQAPKVHLGWERTLGECSKDPSAGFIYFPHIFSKICASFVCMIFTAVSQVSWGSPSSSKESMHASLLHARAEVRREGRGACEPEGAAALLHCVRRMASGVQHALEALGIRLLFRRHSMPNASMLVQKVKWSVV